jgi:hypothetical protein
VLERAQILAEDYLIWEARPATDLERHALEKNLDAAALDYVRISLSCIQCHTSRCTSRWQRRSFC